MLPESHVNFLTGYGYKVSDLKTEGAYWIYNDTHSIVVKKTIYDLFLYPNHEKGTSMVLLATICSDLPLEDFIVLLNAFHFI